MLKGLLSTVVSAALAASAQSAIVYYPGSSVQPPPGFFPLTRDVDFEGDGAADVVFPAGFAICTDDVPTSFCDWPFYVAAAGTNELLMSGFYSFMQPFGARIGGDPPVGAAWSTPGYGAGLADEWWSLRGRDVNGQLAYWGWNGPLVAAGVGYLGVRFHTADGPHYGWIRVRLGFPMVVDWAYETRPSTPIAAGAIGPSSGALQFTADLQSQDGTPVPPESYATFVLTGDTLRGEVSLGGAFRSAEIGGPAPPHTHGKPVANLGPPLVAGTDHTAFFSELTLSRSQLNHLHHGSLYVSIDAGNVTGRITRVEEGEQALGVSRRRR